MKTVLSVSLLCLSFNVFSQSGGLGGAPSSSMDTSANPSGVGFGAGTPGSTTPGVNTPAPGATSPDFTGQPRGNEFPQQEMQDTTPDLPSTTTPNASPALPSTTPSVPNTQDAFPGATNPAGTGVVPGPAGSGTVGP